MRSIRFPLSLLLLTVLGMAACDGAPTDPPTLVPEGAAPLLAPTESVRITEIHYDDASTDEGEAIEITGPAGTDLSGWSVVLYNGSNGSVYDTEALSGTLPSTCGAEGVLVLTFPTNGIQNGAPDGLALVDDAGTVVELLSYEGTFTPVEGPAAGMATTDIGVSEPGSTPEGQSLQRQGDTWVGPLEATFGACNAAGGGDGGGSDGGDGGGAAGVFLSELHYDNAGGDVNEAVEVSAPAGTDLAGWSVVLYNGNGGSSYGTIDLTGVIPGDCRPDGGLVFPYAGIQNGAPDGLALVDPSGGVVEFLSYEGTFTAADGPAAGQTSTDVGVAEGSSTPEDHSLQRSGADQPWFGPEASTFGCEAGSGGGDAPSGPVFLSEIRADQPGGDDDEYFELGGAPGTTLGGVSLVVVGDGSGGAGVVEHVTDLGAYALDGAGALVAAESSFGLGTADLTTSLNFENGDNPTYLLVTGFTGALNQDLDTDDDGTLDDTPWTEVLDCLSLIEFLGLQPVYCDARLGQTVSFTPGHSVRTDDGWISANFTPGDGDTPGTLAFDPATAVAGQIAPWGVSAPGVPTVVSLSASFVPLPVGYNRAIFVNVYDDYRDEVPGAAVEFASTDPAVFTVDEFGNLTAVGVGRATLEVTAVGSGLASEATVEVVPDVASGVDFQDHTEFGVPADGDPSDDLLIRRDEYVVSYNPIRAGANWVSWNLDASHIGDEDRCECYTPDPELPPGAPRVVNFDFTGSGYSRGHMTQSFNRTVTLPDNASTYLTTNILPQAAANNGGPWSDFEFYTNGRAFDGEEVYLVAGGVFGEMPSTLKDEGKVAIPDWTWKVAVFLGPDETLADVRSLDDLEVIAILTPNRIEPGVDGSVAGIERDWERYEVEVDEIEALTGYDLLSLLPDGLENRLESGFDELEVAFHDLVAAGLIERPAANALGAQLRQAGRHLDAGRVRQAGRRLKTLLHLIDVFERNGKVAPAATAALRERAERVVANLSA